MIRSKVIIDETGTSGELHAGWWLRFLYWLSDSVELQKQRHYHKVGWR